MDLLPTQALIVSGITSIIVITCFLSIVAAGIIMLVLIYQKRQVQYMRDKEQLKVIYEKELLESKLEIQEQTLNMISQEIHDNIGQVLSLAKLNINTIAEAIPVTLTEKLNESQQLISKAIQDLRDLSKGLNTDYVTEMGLFRAVEYELELVKKSTNLKAKLTSEGKSVRLTPQQELIIFRIIQEALHNIIKHAHASTVEVKFRFESFAFMLTIEDNGVGFDTTQLTQSTHNSLGLGIRNMHNRARLLNARFQLTSVQTKGTDITLSLSLQTS
jgi:two-component system, NarL family, sensor kinase